MATNPESREYRLCLDFGVAHSALLNERTRNDGASRFDGHERLRRNALLGLQLRLIGLDLDELRDLPRRGGFGVERRYLAALRIAAVERDHVQLFRAVDDEEAVDRREVNADAVNRTEEIGDVKAVVG